MFGAAGDGEAPLAGEEGQASVVERRARAGAQDEAVATSGEDGGRAQHRRGGGARYGSGDGASTRSGAAVNS